MKNKIKELLSSAVPEDIIIAITLSYSLSDEEFLSLFDKSGSIILRHGFLPIHFFIRNDKVYAFSYYIQEMDAKDAPSGWINITP